MPPPLSDVERDARQEQVYAKIVGLNETFGYCPTVREVAACLDLSLGTTQRTLVQLRDLGVITWDPNATRTLRAVEQE